MCKWYLAAAIVILTGCTNTASLIKSDVMIWPDLPDVPIIPNTDLRSLKFEVPTKDSFIALDQENWLNLQYNWEAIKLRNDIYQQRIDQINLQRQEWRQLNKDKNAQNNSTK